MEINPELEKPKDPKMKIPPLDPEGSAGVAFNQPMVAPKDGTFLSPKLYSNTFGLTSESLIDGTIFDADFSQSKRQRMLAEKPDGEASKLGFTPKVEIHSDVEVKIGLVFDDPSQMSIGGKAAVAIAIKEPSIFKNAKDLKPMSKNSFEGGNPELKGEVPPIINDKE